MNSITIARSWRNFDKQQFVAVCELLRVFKDKELHIHLNINNNVNSELVGKIKKNLPENCTLSIYSNKFFDNYAKSLNIPSDTIAKFKEWEWIYHILLYHYLNFKGITYILTYDDDIIFNTREIGTIFHNLEYEIPFSICDQYYDADKCMMGKLCETLGAWVANEYFATTSNDMPTNSGFMGFNPIEVFKPFKNLEEIVNLFEFKKWDHKTMQGTNYDTYKILLQEQSFLSIMSRATSNRQHIVLNKQKDNCFITSDTKEINTSKISHFVGTLKYEPFYLNKIEMLYNIYIKKYS